MQLLASFLEIKMFGNNESFVFLAGIGFVTLRSRSHFQAEVLHLARYFSAHELISLISSLGSST